MSALAFPRQDEPALVRSFALAALVHLLLLGVMFLGVRWQSHRPDTVTVELWDAPPAPPAAPLAAWQDMIRAKIRRNIILPRDLAGNPEAIFDVTLLPTAEVLTVRRRKSSGNLAYDEAVERAILKASPLPKPEQPSVFERQLELRFRPQDR